MVPMLNLVHLKYFYDASLLKSISSAARENFVSQSAISQGIMKLEQALQAPLTTHQRQSFHLTEEGEIVFKESRKIFSAIEGLKNCLNELKGEIAGEVNFACTNALAQFFIPQHYLKISQQYPLIKPKFHRGSIKFIHEALKQEKVSFALVLDGPEFDCYEKEILSQGYFRFYKAKKVKVPSSLYVDHLENPEVIKLCANYLKFHKKELVIQDALSGWGVVATFVQNGCGIGLLPDFIMDKNREIEEVDFKLPLMEYKICALKLKGTFLSRATRAFLDQLNDLKKNK